MDEYVTKILGEVQRLQEQLKTVNGDKPYDSDSVLCGQIIGFLTAVVIYLQQHDLKREHEMIERLLNDMKNGSVN